MKPKEPRKAPTKKSLPLKIKTAVSTKQKEQGQSFPIVGIGASAGGLEAFEQFFSHVPQNIGMAFILIPHLDPGHASMMTELLRRVTNLKVDEAQDGVKAQPDHVYVIPPNKEMSLYHGTINLETLKKAHGLRMPIATA